MSHLKARSRARSPQAKTDRLEMILTKASKLCLSRQKHWSMEDLAQANSLAKGTLYLYFKTKEEVELSLFERLFASWVRDLSINLEGKDRIELPELTELLVQSFCKQPELGYLASRLYPILEQNLSFERARNFKLSMKSQLLSLAKDLSLKISSWDQNTAFRFLLLAHAQLIGLWQITMPSPMVAKVLENPDLHVFRLDLIAELKFCLLALASSMTQKQQKSFHFLGSY